MMALGTTTIERLERRRHITYCEHCGSPILAGHTFSCQVPTGVNPSWPSRGHCRCGFIFGTGNPLVTHSAWKDLAPRIAFEARRLGLDLPTCQRALLAAKRAHSRGLPDAEIRMETIGGYLLKNPFLQS